MKKTGFLDKILGRIDRLDPGGLQKILERLVKERGFLETLFNTIEDGILVVDESGKIIYFNNAVVRLLGLEIDSDIGKGIQTILPEINWETLNPFKQEDSKRIIRLEFDIANPAQRTLRMYAAPLNIEVDGSRRVALIIHDVTEVKKKTAEAIEIERIQALTLLAGSLAHEIGNPLNALSIHTQLMEREIKKIKMALPSEHLVSENEKNLTSEILANLKGIEQSVEKLEKYVKISNGEIRRLDYIMSQYLQAIRPTPPKLKPGDLNIVVKDTLSLLYPEIENRKIVLEERLTPNLPIVSFDHNQIKQVLINLIKNALQAMTKGGKLIIETGYTNDDVWVCVSDTGKGIPVEVMNRIFEPFYTTKREGTGLGLMIVQRIIRDHRGKIEIESRPGEGTKFRIRLPMQKRLPDQISNP
ncbi:MAG: ATP-binding protein [Verrucomicrobiae bacterium]|nr:ATP-binding protein [Verrucomicrobiae bacterium]